MKDWSSTLVVVAAILYGGCASDDVSSGAVGSAGAGAVAGSAGSGGAAGTGSVGGTAGAAACQVESQLEHLDLQYREIAGVDSSSLSLDVYEPVKPEGCPPAPMAIWVHGGGWSIGDKRNQITDKVALFMSEGWVLASVNYRLSPTSATTDPAAVRYPIHDQDVAAALAWLRERASTYHADPSRLLLFGHSAGAGIVSQLVTNERFLAEQGLGLDAVRCGAMLDTEAYDVRAQCEAGNDIYLNAFGSDPAVWDEASAMNHVAAGKGIPASLVVTRGTAARQALSESFVSLLQGASVPATLVYADPLSHAEVNAAVGDPSDTLVTPPLMEFFRGCVQ